MEQVIADVVERVAAGERGEEDEDGAPEPAGAIAREQTEGERAGAHEDEGESVADVEHGHECAPAGERDQRPAALAGARGDVEQDASGNGGSDVSGAGDHDFTQDGGRNSRQRDAALIGTDANAIDGAAHEERGRRVPALVHQHHQQLEWIERPRVPEEHSQKRRRAQRGQEPSVEVVALVHSPHVT